MWDCVAQEVGVARSQVQTWQRQWGGAPANVAAGLRRLGQDVALISCVGNDDAGQALIHQCQTLGIDILGIQTHPLAPTRQVEVLRSVTGEPEFVGFAPADATDFADRHIQAQALPTPLFAGADYLVLGTLCLAAPESGRALRHALDWADDCEVKIFLDVNWRPIFWDNPQTAIAQITTLWPRIDFLKLSASEAQLFFQTTEAAAIAHQIDSIEGVWVTQGDRGPISYYLSGVTGAVQPFAVEAVDATGAGDSFVAGIIAQLCKHGLAQVEKPGVAAAITTYGAAVSALSTQAVGAIAGQPTPQAVADFLSTRE